MTKHITVTVNGRRHEKELEPTMLLREFVRDELDLTGAKSACQDGMCGHCSIRVDDKTVKSCMMLAVEADGAEILTIEGLAENGKLHPLQESFIKNFAAQCGFCTPGMILTALELLDRNPNPTLDEVRDGIDGNICRCTGYVAIAEAILEASQVMQGAKA